MKRFDYIVVGAGSAGCVMAARLSEGGSSVLLLEAGGSDKDWRIQMPAGYSEITRAKAYNWNYYSEPEAHLGGRSLYVPRGKVVGGSSSINAMIYAPGLPIDFDLWAQRGLRGWSFKDVAPYFKKLEAFDNPPSPWRGSSGPLSVKVNDTSRNLAAAFIRAGQQAGFPFTEDMFGDVPDGFGAGYTTIKDGVRWSTANAYLKPALDKKNDITVVKNALVDRIVFQGNRAHQIRCTVSGKPVSYTADKEIVLSAGAVGSPALLQRSGVGPSELLASLGIGVVVDSPGVGANLQEHPNFSYQVECKTNDSIGKETVFPRKQWNGIRWFLNRGGMCAQNHWDSLGLIRTDPTEESPDVVLFLLPIAKDLVNPGVLPKPSFEVNVMLCRPQSRGAIAISSARPEVAPKIAFNMYEDKTDLYRMAKALEVTRNVFGQPALAKFAGREITPGNHVATESQILDWLKRGSYGGYHLSSTCAMGTELSATAVVDGQGRVFGCEGLRVIDASIMPSVTSLNTNAPTIMMAEKIADAMTSRKPPVELSIV